MGDPAVFAVFETKIRAAAGEDGENQRPEKPNREPDGNPFSSGRGACYKLPRFVPCGVIGNTSGFGPEILGSSPGGAMRSGGVEGRRGHR